MKIKLGFILTLGITALQLHSQTNWSEHIAPILYNNCTNCHIEGGIAPFSLVGYNKAVTHSGGVKAATASRSMPPWPASSQYQRYAHERILSNEEIALIADWVNNGTPKGDTTKAPAAPKLNKSGSITGPVSSLKMPNYQVNTQSDEYRCFVLPSGFSQDRFLTALEVIPGDLRVVHHALIFYDTSSKPLQLDAADPKPGYLSFGGTGSSKSELIGLWVPGSEPYYFPSGFGIKLPKKGKIILQIHYPGGVSNTTDSTRVILRTTTTSLRPVAIAPALNHNSQSLLNGPLYIPTNQVKTFNNSYTIPVNLSVFTVGPHMHLIGKSIKAMGVTPAKDTIRFVDIPKWDFHWQRAYTFRNIVKVPGGTTLHGTATYDNTTANPFNPNNPPLAVGLGEGTNDEMFLVYFWYTLYQAGDENIVIDNSGLKNVSKTVMAQNPDMKVYPNPGSGLFHLESPVLRPGNSVLRIYSADGKLLLNKTLTAEKNSITADLTELPAGIYLVQAEQNGIYIPARLIKQ